MKTVNLSLSEAKEMFEQGGTAKEVALRAYPINKLITVPENIEYIKGLGIYIPMLGKFMDVDNAKEMTFNEMERNGIQTFKKKEWYLLLYLKDDIISVIKKHNLYNPFAEYCWTSCCCRAAGSGYVYSSGSVYYAPSYNSYIVVPAKTI